MHCLVLDGVYRRGAEGEPPFVEVSAPTDEALQAELRPPVAAEVSLFAKMSDEVNEALRQIVLGCLMPARGLAALEAAERNCTEWT